MNVVQKIIEVSQKIGTVQEFYEFSEGIQRCLSVIKLIVTLKTTLKHSGKLFLIHEDYNFPRNFFFNQSMKYPKAFNSMFKFKSEGQEGVRNLINSIKKNT